MKRLALVFILLLAIAGFLGWAISQKPISSSAGTAENRSTDWP